MSTNGTGSAKSARKPRNSSRKNIREAYLQFVKQNNGMNGLPKSRSISNLANYNPSLTSSSGYLEDQYSLVKRILTATSALEKLKRSASKDASNSNANSISNSVALSSSRSKTGTPLYKSPEEYYEEVMSLKKRVKAMEKNETIQKAKIDYYENEIVKKNQEIEELLNPKIGDDNKTLNVKSDQRQIFNLKKKILKLELQLKTKENELQKLQSDLKTTNNKEMRIANEMFKQEIKRLNEQIVNFSKLTQLNLLSDRDSNRSGISSSISSVNNKENINKHSNVEHELGRLKAENQLLIEQLHKLKDKQMNASSTTLDSKQQNFQMSKLNEDNEYYRQLCHTKEDEILRLKREIDNLKERDISDNGRHSRTSMNGLDKRSDTNIQKSVQSSASEIIKRQKSPSLHSSRLSSRHNSEEDLRRTTAETADSIDLLQSVFKGHSERVKYFDLKQKNKKDLKLNDSVIIEHKKQSPSPARNKAHSKSPSHSRRNSIDQLNNSKISLTKKKSVSNSDDDFDILMD